MFDFKEKIIFITGGTRGIGLGIAKAFGEHGALPVIVGRNEQTASDACESLKKIGLRADYVTGDVSSLSDVTQMIDKVLDKHKAIDILINNAGITKDNLLLRMSEDDWNDVLEINLKGVFHCTKLVAKKMIKHKRGRIINITSIIGLSGNIGQANYAASKAGVIGFTKSVAKELASRNITVNAVAPGYIATDMTAELTESVQQDILKRIPQKRLGKVSDVADTCLFLASDHANYITGQTIVVDGGLNI